MKNLEGARIAISWIECDEKISAVAYDRRDQSLIYPVIDYCLYLSQGLALNSKTVANEILYIKRFMEYLNGKSIAIADVTDSVLLEFRDNELLRVLGQKNRSGNERAAKRTVNAKLRRVYMFLYWFQAVEQQAAYLIGSTGSQVRSTVGDVRGMVDRRLKTSDRSRFPLAFRLAGERSRHRTKYVATSRDVDRLVDSFLRQSDPIAQRNILMLEIAERVGMRRGSINSLRVDQFDREKLDAVGGDLSVVPDAQKFGYENRFDIPFRLAYRIFDYIDSVRKPLMLQKGWTEKTTCGRLFFSFKDGKPLRDQTLSQIFGKALDDLGIDQHGANIHSLRRKYANDEIVREIDRRIAQGLDTSAASVAASVSITLGHSNPSSIAPYISRARARAEGTPATTSLDQVCELEQANRALKIEIARLKRQLNVDQSD